MRICFYTNMPHGSVGYSTISEKLLPLINEKYPCCLLANWGLSGSPKIYLKDYPIPIYGCSNDGLIYNHYKDFEANILITIYDMWAVDSIPQLAARGAFSWAAYTLIDTEEFCPKYIENLKSAYRIIPLTKHGEKECKKHFPDKTTNIIPLGVDTKVFKPLWNTIEEKGKWKEELGFTKDTFVIGVLGDHKGDRKRFMENLEGIKIFKDRNPNIKIGVYIHTKLTQDNPMDFNITALVEKIGLTNLTRTVEPYNYSKGVPEKEIAEIFNGMDVHCACSAGEGFGMAYLEAAACGTPSLATDFASIDPIKENVTGFLVKPIHKQFIQSIAKKAIPDPNDIANKLEMIYAIDPMYWKEQGPKFAQDFDWETKIVPMWLKFLEQLERDLERECLQVPQPSEYLKNKAKNVRIIE